MLIDKSCTHKSMLATKKGASIDVMTHNNLEELHGVGSRVGAAAASMEEAAHGGLPWRPQHYGRMRGGLPSL